MSRIALIIPVFNESGAIPHLAACLRDVLPKIAARQGVQFSAIFVDDGSGDGTADELAKHRFGVPSQLIVLSRNFGKEAALSAGLDAANQADIDAAILMDADLQHPPALIEALIEEWRAGHDVVYYIKKSRAGEGLGRTMASKLFYRLANHGSRFSITPDAGDFRLIDAHAVAALCQLPERERFLKGLYSWIGFRQKGLHFEVAERAGGGETKFGLPRLIALAIDGLTSFSVAPIRVLSLAGLTITALSMLYILWIIGEFLLFGAPFSGFASIVVLISFFGGVQLFFIGMIGEYVGKTLTEVKKRPLYLIRETRMLDDD